MKQKVLFVCIHNSARSQMAEAWLNHLYGDRFEAMSAGLEPGTLNHYAVRRDGGRGYRHRRRADEECLRPSTMQVNCSTTW